MTGRILIVLTGLVSVAGCTSTAREGVITGTALPGWYGAGTIAPDVKYRSMEGEEASFTKARQPIAIVAFVAPKGSECCWLEPGVVNIADQLWDLPVTVAQFSQPTSECPHGPGCVEVCNLRTGRVMSLCDAQKLAWRAFGKPASGTLILIGADNTMLLRGSLGDPGAVIDEAKRLGQIENDRRRGPGGERLQIY